MQVQVQKQSLSVVTSMIREDVNSSMNDDEARDAPEASRANTNAVSATENNHIQRKREGATNLMDHRACREARSAPDALRGMVNRMTGNAATPEVQPGTNACEPRLPEFKSVQPPVFRWGDRDGAEFVKCVREAYNEVVHWRRNIFLVPSGKAGKDFVLELTRLFEAYASHSALESIALDAILLACTLLLQKPHVASKARDHGEALERRLRAWQIGDIEGLLREGRTIQNSLPKNSGAQSAQVYEERRARTFSKLIFEGKLHAALRYLSDNSNSGLLALDELCGDDNVRHILAEKHPAARPVDDDALVLPEERAGSEVHPVLFQQITGEKIRSIALRVKGAAGPSGVDAAGWRRILVSFHRESKNLCAAIAAFARRLCTDYLDPSSLRAFLACRLIPINKNPGVRPIGVCEVLRRLIGKAIMTVVSNSVLEATGPMQLCAGHEAGAEAAVHAMRELFADEKTEAVLLVDASNAFNNLNRKVALLNISTLCPAIAKVLINCYRDNARLFVGGETLLSQEGTTQGDPLAMAMFALASVPLAKKVTTEGATQAWFADDASAGGILISIRQWWDTLLVQGPKYGYYPNAIKTALITKREHHEKALSVFKDTGVEITVAGKRYLGGALGSDEFIAEFITKKVEQWIKEVERLSEFAISQPHAAFAAFTHGVRHRWTYLSRVLPIPVVQIQPLEKVIRTAFLPSLTSQSAFSDSTRRLLAQPPCCGGLGIIDPSNEAQKQYQASSAICQPLVKAIIQQHGEPLAIRAEQRWRKMEEKRRQLQDQKKEYTAMSEELSSIPELHRSIIAASEKGASAWLTALPIDEHGFTLHKGAFRDGLALRYDWPMRFQADTCICGAKFDPDHKMVCRQGGFLTMRHNELRDLTADLMRRVCAAVKIEPELQPVTGEHLPRSTNKEDGARLDVRAQGFWDGTKQDAYFDVRVFHPFAPSYRDMSLSSLYRQHEKKKKNEYANRVREIEHGTFTPLVFSTTGGMGREAEVVFKKLAGMISTKTDERYSVVIGWLRTRVSFSLLRSALTCLRGTPAKRIKPTEDIAIANAEAAIKQ